MIERKEFNAWLEHKVTKAIFEEIQLRRIFYNQALLNGVPAYESKIEAIFEHIGRINAYDELLGIEYSDLDEELKEEEE